MSDKVSIVIPCYNQAQYLRQCVDSCIAQTYDNFEIIIVNDGSTDSDVARIIKEYEGRPLNDGWNKIRTVTQQNYGLSVARNAGIAASKTEPYEYILPLDSDDFIEPWYLERTVREMKPDVGVVGSWAHCFDAKDYIWYLKSPATIEMLMRDNCVPVCSLIRRRCLSEVGGYNIQMNKGYEDWNLWIDIAKRGHKIVIVPEAIFWYREKECSMLKDSTKIRPVLIEQIKRLHPELWPPDGQRSMVGKWKNHRPETAGAGHYGIQETYIKAAEFLGGGPIEDWGCGTCYAKKFFPNGYVGVDGTPDYCDVTAELAKHTSDAKGILLRHVLEHNFEWEAILKNALASTKKLAVVVCSEFGSETHLIRFDEFGIPIFSFRKEDLTRHFTQYREEVVQGQAWGTTCTETIFYVERP